ncbi:hypothetical protein BJX62DRAFT_239916 [Aspergillus germanicus]
MAYSGTRENGQASAYQLLPESNPRPPRKASRRTDVLHRYSRIYNTWLWECLGILLSISCFVAIICILATFNNNPPPGFAYGFTLNALISLLGTVSKSSLVYIVGECISQLKWNCRGPLGSTLVLLEHKGQSLVSLGAMIIVFALETTVDVAGNSSNIATATQVEDMSADILGLDTDSLVFAGAWSAHSELPQIRTTYPSGNCTWEVFHSIEMCSQCEDIDKSTAFFTVTECDLVQINMTILETHAETCFINYSRADRFQSQLLYFPFNYPSDVVEPAFSHFSHSAGVTETYAGVENPLLAITNLEVGLARSTVAGIPPLLDLATSFKVNRGTQCVLSHCARAYNASACDAAHNCLESDFLDSMLHIRVGALRSVITPESIGPFPSGRAGGFHITKGEADISLRHLENEFQVPVAELAECKI